MDANMLCVLLAACSFSVCVDDACSYRRGDADNGFEKVSFFSVLYRLKCFVEVPLSPKK